MNFIRTSLKYKQVTLTVFAAVFAMGIYSLLTMPRREDPKLTVPQGLVIAYYPGATVAQTEEQLTRKLEQYLFQFDEVYKSKTYSVTREGVAVVNVWLNDDVKKPEIFWNKLRHQLLIARNLDLPKGVIGPVVNSDFGDTEALLIGVESDKADYAQLKEYAGLLEDNIRSIKATSKIRRLGEQKEQITVYFDPAKLSLYGVGLSQIAGALQSQNAILASGEVSSGSNKVSLNNSGYFKGIEEIGNQIVCTSKTGEVVRLRDIADLKREYTEPASSISVNGHKAIIVSVQMEDGNNIVWFGREVNRKIAEVSKRLPSSVRLTTIVSQPEMVQTNVSHFLREFMIAVVVVILVIILLLPFRVALVAATAIPVTIATTFMIMHAFGIELHQVSLSSLIVVLGMVVDDAIVVTDNYIELLDKGTERFTAAWRSASDLIVPILTATITIIASFLPMLILTGAIGEFIRDLPVTVTIALSSSFIVAMMVTPSLCLFFIKKGLRSENLPEKGSKEKKSSFFDILQMAYNKAIDGCIRHHFIVISFSLLLIVLAFVLLITGVRQQFMPYAERNQFVVELRMPTGTKLEVTQQAIARIEKMIRKDQRLVSFATFCGSSAPRVYYNFSPEFPASNYAQILINTTGNKSTETFAHDLALNAGNVIPEGRVQVKLMQQGQPMIAPVEIRLWGDDISKLKEIAEQVKVILENKKGSYLVNDDFREDLYSLRIVLKDQATRLGFTSESISQSLYAGLKGFTVSTLFEGDKPVDIVLRMDAAKRERIGDLENIYLESPVTGASVPLHQIATVVPGWQNGNTVHRNGLRCITIRSETKNDVLPSELLASAMPEIEKLNLPQGYSISYGGELENKNEVMSQLVLALFISLGLIFLILLFQFRNLKEVLIIMLTIPLSLFGAVLGLYVTGNYFGLTAFMGIISLSGIVVRNAIILIDHTRELVGQGIPVREAAIESGKRRMRPVFLTAMAAALGVLPMILSGSSLWSPLASVIAFGVTWSMIMALLTVPVMYSMIMKPKGKNTGLSRKLQVLPKIGKVLVLLLLVCIPQMFSTGGLKAQPVQEVFSLSKIQEMALRNNHLLKMKQMEADAKKQKINEDMVKYFPQVSVGGIYQYNSSVPGFTIAQGSLGTLPAQLGGASLPPTDLKFDLGENHTLVAGAGFYQPITQIPMIHAGIRISETELAITLEEKSKAAMQIKQAAEKLYYGLLILQKQQEEAEFKKAAAQARLRDVINAVEAGKTTVSTQLGLNANLADEEQNLLKISIQTEDYMADLKHLTGIPDSVQVILDSVTGGTSPMPAFSAYSISGGAQSGNIDLKVAQLTLVKAKDAVNASRLSYIPDLGVYGMYAYQDGINVYPANNVFIGLALTWNIQGLFSTTYSKKQRLCQMKQAEENIANTKEEIGTETAKAYRHLLQSRELITVAQKVAEFRKEELKIQLDRKDTGLNPDSAYLDAEAAMAKAEADLYAACLSYRISLTDMQILTGNY